VPLALGNLPILPAHYWKDRDITKITVEPPLGSGPYKVGDFQVGRYIVWERVEDWWAKDLPVNRGRYNFDKIRWDYFRDSNARFEGIKGNIVDVREESIPKMWALEYNFPAVQQGLLIKEMQPISSPAIMLTRVVLPVPFGARMPREFPSSTLNEARSRMTLRLSPVQKDLLTFLNSIM